MLQFIYIWTLESFTIKELIICLQYHAWNVHKYEFTICLQFISCSVTIRNNTYKYTMLLSDVEHVDHIQRRLHKSRYMVSNAHKSGGRIKIAAPPKNVSGGLLGACNNCRTTWPRQKARKALKREWILKCIFIWIFIRSPNYSAYLYIGRKNFLKKWKKEINRDKKRSTELNTILSGKNADLQGWLSEWDML